MAKDDYAGTNGRNYKIRKRLFFFILHSILHRLLNFAPVNFNFFVMNVKTHEESEQRYVDILSNGGFKAFFGDESNKEAVMMLLNTLLPKHWQIKEIEYQPTEHQGPVIGLCK